MSLLHKITIQKASVFFDTKDGRVLSWLRPRRTARRFVVEFNRLFGGVDSSAMLKKASFKLVLYNRAYNLYPALHAGIINALRGNCQKSLAVWFDRYKRTTGKEFLKVADLDTLKAEIERLQNKYKGIIDAEEKTQQSQSQEDTFDFDQLIIGVEQILQMSLPRSVTVAQFYKYYKKAVEHGRNQAISKPGGARAGKWLH